MDGRPSSSRPVDGQRPINGRPNGGSPNNGRADDGRPNGGRPIDGRPNDGQRPALGSAASSHPLAQGSASPPATLRTVLVNAQPWANFTIDSDPTQHQTVETVRLAPGPHVIHFANPQLGTRDRSITVPDSDGLKVVVDLRN
jgi:hypothetical protein